MKIPMKPFERLRRLASDYEAGVSHSRADQIAATAMLRARPQVVHRRWPAIAAAGAALAIGVVGMGALADQAVPGQVLYPLDRAYESVGELIGFNQNQSEERLVEAIALLDRGRGSEAVLLVDEALAEIGRDPDLEDYQATVAAAVAQPVTTTTQPHVAEVATPQVTPAGGGTPGASEPASDSVVTTPPDASGELPVISAAAEADPVTSLRLATEYLLRTVRDAKVAKAAGMADGLNEEFSVAASDIIAAAKVVKDQVALAAGDVAQDATSSTTQTTTVEPSETTTTTEPEDGSASTTVPEDGSTSTTVPEDGSTTTTVPEDGSTTTTVPEDGSTTTTVPQGPIVLPIQP